MPRYTWVALLLLLPAAVRADAGRTTPGLVIETGARHAVAMHFGTFDLTDEPLDEPPVRFRAEADRRGLGPRAWVLRVGETRAW